VIKYDVNDGYDEDGSGDHDNDGDDECNEYDCNNNDLALQDHQATLSTLLHLSSTYPHRPPIIIYQSPVNIFSMFTA
jgi:hypothetical protein